MTADRSIDAPGPREVELKLFVPPSGVDGLWSAPLVAELAIGPLQVARLENRYFDTSDGELAARGIALRLRRIGRRWVQTLKTAAADERALSSRGEWEMPVAGPALELARFDGTPLAALDDAARPLAARLRHVHTTRFRRETRLLRLPGGSVVELAFDVGSIVAGRGRDRLVLPICEVEIERKAGPAGAGADAAGGEPDADEAGDDLLRFAARLSREVSLIPLAESKAARGHRLAARRPLDAARVALPAPDFGDLPAHHLARVLAACEATLLANVHALFEQAGAVAAATDGGDAAAPIATGDGSPAAERLDAGVEFVHQARVAIRRMRSAIRLFRPVVAGRRLDRLDGDLREMGRAFGGARDWDVLLEITMPRLVDSAGDDPVRHEALTALRDEAGRRRADGRRALMDYLDAGAFGSVAIGLARTIDRLSRAEPSRGRSRGSIGVWAPARLTLQRARVVRRARRIAVLDDEARHALRIEVKRLRYALDLFEPIYERAAVDTFRDTLAALQDRLGRINDAIVGNALLASIAELPSLDALRAPYAAWLARHVRRQLPKVAAGAVELELTPVPWHPTSLVKGRNER